MLEEVDITSIGEYCEKVLPIRVVAKNNRQATLESHTQHLDDTAARRLPRQLGLPDDSLQLGRLYAHAVGSPLAPHGDSGLLRLRDPRLPVRREREPEELRHHLIDSEGVGVATYGRAKLAELATSIGEGIPATQDSL